MEFPPSCSTSTVTFLSRARGFISTWRGCYEKMLARVAQFLFSMPPHAQTQRREERGAWRPFRGALASQRPPRPVSRKTRDAHPRCVGCFPAKPPRAITEARWAIQPQNWTGRIQSRRTRERALASHHHCQAWPDSSREHDTIHFINLNSRECDGRTADALRQTVPDSHRQVSEQCRPVRPL